MKSIASCFWEVSIESAAPDCWYWTAQTQAHVGVQRLVMEGICNTEDQARIEWQQFANANGIDDWEEPQLERDFDDEDNWYRGG